MTSSQNCVRWTTKIFGLATLRLCRVCKIWNPQMLLWYTRSGSAAYESSMYWFSETVWYPNEIASLDARHVGILLNPRHLSRAFIQMIRKDAEVFMAKHGPWSRRLSICVKLRGRILWFGSDTGMVPGPGGFYRECKCVITGPPICAPILVMVMEWSLNGDSIEVVRRPRILR